MSRFAAVTIAFAALAGFAAVAAGAWAAHGVAPEAKALLETASLYAMTHALAMIGAALARERMAGLARPFAAAAAVLFAAGIAGFSGSLAALALGAKTSGAPIGGAAFLLGWALFAAAALMSLRHHLVDQP